MPAPMKSQCRARFETSSKPERDQMPAFSCLVVAPVAFPAGDGLRNGSTAIADKFGKPLPHWTIHDLRRTAATRMVDLGESPHVVEAVLNHVSGHRAGVAGIYNRSFYKAEKAQALSKWATHVLAVAKGKTSNVTPLRRGA
jgi:hypothetical protein